MLCIFICDKLSPSWHRLVNNWKNTPNLQLLSQELERRVKYIYKKWLLWGLPKVLISEYWQVTNDLACLTVTWNKGKFMWLFTVQRPCSTTDRHHRQEEDMKSWKKKKKKKTSVNPSHWDIKCISPEKMLERPTETIVGLIVEGFLLFKPSL